MGRFAGTLGLWAFAATLVASSVSAEVCDYRPSKLGGKTATDVAIGASTTVGGAGAAATAAGFYTLVHATSGATMLGSTMAGASAAGTVGIIGGTAGLIGSTAAVILNPFVWVPALVVGAGGAGLEGVCAFFVDERITEFDEVLEVMRSFETNADPEYFRLRDDVVNPYIQLRGEDDEWVRYSVENLYIVEQVLKHRDFGRNTTLGRVIYVPATRVEAKEIAESE